MNEPEPRDQHDTKSRIPMQQSRRNRRHQRDQCDRGQKDAKLKAAAMFAMKVVARFEFALVAHRVHQPVRRIHQPHRDKHGDRNAARQFNPQSPCDEPRPSRGYRGCVQRQQVPKRQRTDLRRTHARYRNCLNRCLHCKIRMRERPRRTGRYSGIRCRAPGWPPGRDAWYSLSEPCSSKACHMVFRSRNCSLCVIKRSSA